MTSEIAIVGISSIFPGAPNVVSFHDNIISRRSNIKNADFNWLQNSYTDSATNKPGKIRSKLRATLGEIAFFDPLKYGIMPNSIDGGDPDHYLSLRIASEAIDDSKLPVDYDHTSTGVVVGRGTYFNRGFGTVFQHGIIVDQTIDILEKFLSPTQLEVVRDKLVNSLPDFNSGMVGGIIPNLVSGRIANKLGLGGPNFLIDAACASSLIAVEHACEQLNLEKADLMLVGGVQASTPPQVHMVFDLLDALALDGLSPFSKEAEGTVLSEGVGFVVLSRLADAQRLGLNIYATIQSVASSSDGRGKGLFAPSSSGQRLAIQRAYKNHETLKTQVRYLETHGTGMPLGDETELRTLLAEFFEKRTQPSLHLGNLKSLIGHCIPASGIAGLISATLAVKYGVFPPFEIDNPIDKMNENSDKFILSSKAQPWLGNNQLRRTAAVNAFGFGGINSHLVVQQYTSTDGTESVLPGLVQPAAIFFLSSNSVEEMIESISSLIAKIDHGYFHQAALSSYLLATSNTVHEGDELRGYVVATGYKQAQERLAKLLDKVSDLNFDSSIGYMSRKRHTFMRSIKLTNKQSSPVFVYPGEGSQSAGMLRELALYFPIINNWLSSISESLDVDLPLVESILQADQSGSRLPAEAYEINISTGLVFAANMSINELLTSWGITPAAHVGHSTGQNSALFAGNWLKGNTRESLLKNASLQVVDMKNAWANVDSSRVIDENHAVFILQHPYAKELDELINQFPDEIIISMRNCPDQYVAVIPRNRCADIEARLQKCCVMLLEMPVKRPYHTRHFEQAAFEMREYYDKTLVYNESSSAPVYSCTSGRLIETSSQAQSELGSLMQAPVEFENAINNMISDGYDLFVECGNGSSTSNFIKSICKSESSIEILSSQGAAQGGLESFLQCIAFLWTTGNDIKTLYIKHQAELEKAISLGINRSPNEVNLNLLMPRAQLSLNDSNFSLPKPSEGLESQAKEIEPHFKNNTDFSNVNSKSEINIGKGAALLHDHTLPNRNSTNEQIPANGLSVVPMAVFIGLSLSAIKNKLGAQSLTLTNLSMSKWAHAKEENQFAIELTNVVGNQIHCTVNHNGIDNFTCYLKQTHSVLDIEKKFLASFSFGQNKKPYPWNPSELYLHGMFHGPFYQVIKQINHCSGEEMEGIIATSTNSSQLNTIQIFDGLAQTSAFWAANRHGHRFHTFPLGIDELNIANVSATPTLYKFLIRNTSETSSALIFDCLLVDSDGNVILKISSFKHSLIKLPTLYHDCFGNCEAGFYSRRLPIAATEDICIAAIDNAHILEQFTHSTSFFTSIFCHMWFNQPEMKALGSKLSNISTLLTLLSKKECIRYLLLGLKVPLKAREIFAGSDGGIHVFNVSQKSFKRVPAPTTVWNKDICLSIASLSYSVVLISLDPISDSLDCSADTTVYIKSLIHYVEPAIRLALKLDTSMPMLNNVALLDQFAFQGTINQYFVKAGTFAFGSDHYGWAAVK